MLFLHLYSRFLSWMCTVLQTVRLHQSHSCVPDTLCIISRFLLCGLLVKSHLVQIFSAVVLEAFLFYCQVFIYFFIILFFFFISEVICLPLNSKDQMRRMQRRVVLFWRLFAPHSWSYLLWFTVCLKRYFGKFRSTRITLISVSLPPTLEWQGNSGGKLKKPSFAIWTRNPITCESPPMPPPPPCRSFLIMFFMKRIRLTDELWVNAVSTMQSYTPDLN